MLDEARAEIEALSSEAPAIFGQRHRSMRPGLAGRGRATRRRPKPTSETSENRGAGARAQSRREPGGARLPDAGPSDSDARPAARRRAAGVDTTYRLGQSIGAVERVRPAERVRHAAAVGAPDAATRLGRFRRAAGAPLSPRPRRARHRRRAARHQPVRVRHHAEDRVLREPRVARRDGEAAPTGDADAEAGRAAIRNAIHAPLAVCSARKSRARRRDRRARSSGSSPPREPWPLWARSGGPSRRDSAPLSAAAPPVTLENGRRRGAAGRDDAPSRPPRARWPSRSKRAGRRGFARRSTARTTPAASIRRARRGTSTARGPWRFAPATPEPCSSASTAERRAALGADGTPPHGSSRLRSHRPPPHRRRHRDERAPAPRRPSAPGARSRRRTAAARPLHRARNARPPRDAGRCATHVRPAAAATPPRPFVTAWRAGVPISCRPAQQWLDAYQRRDREAWRRPAPRTSRSPTNAR